MEYVILSVLPIIYASILLVERHCCLNLLGVMPVNFLNAVLNEDFELKPTSYNISDTVLLQVGSDNILLASSIRYLLI